METELAKQRLIDFLFTMEVERDGVETDVGGM